jgi:hypothetical protein
MNVPPEDLTPLELATQRDGMAMIDKLQEMKREAGESIILGEDGKPIKTEKSIKPPGEEELNLRQKAMQDVKARVERNAERLSEIMQTNMHAAQCATTIHAAWQLLYWALNDLLTIRELDNELVQQLSDHLRASAMSTGYDVNTLMAKIRNTCVPFMHERIAYYAQEKRKRDEKIKEIEKRMGKKGIALPCLSLCALFEEGKPFSPGGMLVLHGKPAAVRAALKLCIRHHIKENAGHPFYLSTEEKPVQPKNPTVMPLQWWVGKARSIVEMEDTLQHVVDKQNTVLLAVEDVDRLWETDERERSKEHIKVKATARLYQWAYTNQVAVIVGDASEAFNEKIYGGLPHCAVALTELDGKPHVVIGNDTLELGSEDLK